MKPTPPSHRPAQPILAAGGTYRAEVEMTAQGWRDDLGRSRRKILDQDTNESLWLFAGISARRQAEDRARAAARRLEGSARRRLRQRSPATGCSPKTPPT